MKVLKGKLYLSKIDKTKVQEDSYGKFIWIDVVPRRQADKNGYTHNVTTWDSETRATTYLADLKEREVGTGEAAKPKTEPAQPQPQFSPEDMANAQALGNELDSDLPF